MPLPARRMEAPLQSRLLLLPLLAVVIGAAVTELGLWSIKDNPESGSEWDPASAWFLQSFITGQITIFMLAAWGHAFCRFRWPNDEAAHLNLPLAAAWACFGWTLWMALRSSAVAGDELIALWPFVSLPVLATTVPLLWHATRKIGPPRRSLWLCAGFLAFTLLLQCWGGPKIAEDPVSLFILNSALIAAAVVLWLIVYSLPPAPAPTRRTQ